MAGEPADAPPATQRRRLLDLGSSITIGITLVLFAVALFTTGFSQTSCSRPASSSYP